jgi:hypothetical protein
MRSAAVQLDEGLAVLVMLAVKTLGEAPFLPASNDVQPAQLRSIPVAPALDVARSARGTHRPETGAEEHWEKLNIDDSP